MKNTIRHLVSSVVSVPKPTKVQGAFWGISALQKDSQSYSYAHFLRLDLSQNPLLPFRHLTTDTTLVKDQLLMSMFYT